LNKLVNTTFSGLDFREDFIYDLMSEFPAALNLDIGAAAGGVAAKIVAASPQSKVLCYEPWEGNFRHFTRRVGGLPNVTLIRKAVSDFTGRGAFYVSKTVTGAEKGWEKMIGYSSAGKLVPEDRAKELNAEKVHSVEVCTVDDTVDEHVRLMKIDVQGGELGVLNGARRTVERHGIDMMYVEFSGSLELLELIHSFGFAIFESMYVAVPVRIAPRELRFQSIQRTLHLSNGRTAYGGYPRGMPRDFGGLCRFMESYQKTTAPLWTDLICVHSSYLQDFFGGIARFVGRAALPSRRETTQT